MSDLLPRYDHSMIIADLNTLFSRGIMDSENAAMILAGAIIAALAIILFSLTLRHRKRAKEEWKRAAKGLHLTYVPSAFLSLNQLIRGSHRGHKVKVLVHRHRQGQNTKYYTEYECPLAPEWDCGVVIGSRGKGLMKGFVPALSRADIREVGAPRFDDAFYVTGTLPERIQNILQDPDLIEALRGLTSYYRHVEILDGKVRFRHRRVAKDAHKIRMAISRLVDIATQLNDAVSDEEPEPIADLFPEPHAPEQDSEELTPAW